MAVPSLPLSGDKIALRRRAREQRRAYVESLSPAQRDKQEQALAAHLAPLIATSRIIAAYAPMPDEISPMPALEQARQSSTTIAFPAFNDHLATLRFLAGEPTETGPFGVMQPPLSSIEVHPDLILVPLVAIDAAYNRLGQGKGHYDRVLPELRRRGALLVGIGWPVQRLDQAIEPEAWDVTLDGFASPDGLDLKR
ncbi:5-formyltetrahydrofolate cyclo-ligase [Sphingomonas sp. HDW15A]|uniref:5-formyltetrahydrofolate cyclo-ligase n=1 Tax=Sphingomonas sp. HDW15A TaxID=2714942 RepID=UPI0014099C8E|nr:5-formyltetrahydrofolate cyclo-ligase [Sphingomonas sp. HDW15A]QIK95785.1 5-formyltetrahydrofolate cyclo-ligase [Sphingomonas sp. HDW15A]